MLALWWAFGDQFHLAEAERLLGNFERVEKAKYGGKGYVVNEAMSPPSMKPWMHGIVLNAAARHAWLTGSKRFHALMKRMKTFLRRQAIARLVTVVLTTNYPSNCYRRPFFAESVAKLLHEADRNLVNVSIDI